MAASNMDPWLSAGNENSSNMKSFEDDFSPGLKLPDSQEYLATLERKLAQLKQRQSKQDLVKSLEETKKSCMFRLLTDGLSNSENPDDLLLDTPLNNTHNTLLRHIAPERQALTLGELVELLKADQLSEKLAEDTSESSSESSVNDK